VGWVKAVYNKGPAHRDGSVVDAEDVAGFRARGQEDVKGLLERVLVGVRGAQRFFQRLHRTDRADFRWSNAAVVDDDADGRDVGR